VIEFTGERVIPGEVNDDLWAEHLARYAFAARFAGRRILDLGCGTGYGTAELAANAAFAAGIDIATEAIAHARSHYPLPNIRFLVGSATAVPFAAQSFDLITAFEVIEHLSDWRSLLDEARRVIAPNGVFLVSTPNKLYYAESRAKEGPNPFHIHEFEFAEFREALAQYFPNVTVLLQNRLESFVFSPSQAVFRQTEARIDGTRGSAEEAHFFIGICSVEAKPEPRTFSASVNSTFTFFNSNSRRPRNGSRA
jgi:ubiquinone/menaquinone biosynthesis C-methylase UbiE